MVTKMVTKREYVLPIGNESLGKFAAYALTYAQSHDETAVVVKVETAYSESDWLYGMDQQVIVFRATEHAHEFMTLAIERGWL